MKLGYANYGMHDEDIFDALPRLGEIGYEAMELTVSNGWTTTPDRLDTAARDRVRELFQSLGFPPPSLLGMPPPRSTDENSGNLESFRVACELSRDLNYSQEPAVISTIPGGYGPDWDNQKDSLRDDLLRMAEVAADYNVLLAAEPHIGMPFDTPEKAAWLMQATNHPNIKLNFDYSQFYVAGIPLQHSIDLCMPHAAHIHVKDGRLIDGDLEFLLPGEGNLDLTDFFTRMAATGTTIPMTVEVSGMVWNKPGYDAWAVAERCYAVLSEARDQASG